LQPIHSALLRAKRVKYTLKGVAAGSQVRTRQLPSFFVQQVHLAVKENPPRSVAPDAGRNERENANEGEKARILSRRNRVESALNKALIKRPVVTRSGIYLREIYLLYDLFVSRIGA
jgi:hypothetical protein